MIFIIVSTLPLESILWPTNYVATDQNEKSHSFLCCFVLFFFFPFHCGLNFCQKLLDKEASRNSTKIEVFRAAQLTYLFDKQCLFVSCLFIIFIDYSKLEIELWIKRSVGSFIRSKSSITITNIVCEGLLIKWAFCFRLIDVGKKHSQRYSNCLSNRTKRTS